MAHPDTIKLLQECDAGTKMGVSSIDEILEKVQDEKLKKLLSESKAHHEKLEEDIEHLLEQMGAQEKDPNPMAKGMSWMKTNAKMMMEGSDNTCADLITDGCNMGIKTLYRYMNQYKAADEKSKKLTEDIIREEEHLRQELRCYL